MYFTVHSSAEEMSWALIDFAPWCFETKGNTAGTISGKFAAVQYFHRIKPRVEVVTTSPVIMCALRGIERLHIAQGKRSRPRLPITWKMLLDGESLIPPLGKGGRARWLCLSLSFFWLTRSDEMFAGAAGVVHRVHCLTRGDVTFILGSCTACIASHEET